MQIKQNLEENYPCRMKLKDVSNFITGKKYKTTKND